MKGFYQKFSEILEDILKTQYDIMLQPPLWEIPAKQEFGDLSTTVALKLASKLNKEPLEIATDLKIFLNNKLGNQIKDIQVIKPGFVNIFVSKETLLESLKMLLEEKENFFENNFGERILLEFVSANPTGPLSIAHGRQAVVGDVIANILKFYGNYVEKEYYINDEGRQIELLVESVKERIKELEGKDFKIPEEGYVGEYIKDVAKAYLEESKKIKDLDLKKFAINYILSWIKKDLESLGIKFDRWESQERLIKEGKVEKVIEELKQKGLIYQDQQSLFFSATKFGDSKDRVVKKSDGEFTYFASDIAYHKDKLDRNYTKLINIWGPDHHGYIKRVEAAIEALGYDKNLLQIIIIQLVTLKTKAKMSKRKGTIILLSDLIKTVGKDITRFYYLLRRNSSHLEFDVELAKEVSLNNLYYYIQYVCARIESIFQKAKIEKVNSLDVYYLKEDDEINYLRTLMQFSNCLDKAYYTLEPVFIVEFLKDLAGYFHKFYEKKRILCDDENITKARLCLLEATRIIMHLALKLLGIEPLKKM